MYAFSRGTFLLSPSNGDMSQTTVTAVAIPDSVLNAPVGTGAGDIRHSHFTLIVARFTGAPVGTLQLYGSDNGINFDIPLGAAVSVTAAGTASWDLIGTGCHFVQLLYTKSSGTGTLTVTFADKKAGM